MDYSRKITLSLGMEMALRYATWQLGAGVVWWSVKRRHGCGSCEVAPAKRTCAGKGLLR